MNLTPPVPIVRRVPPEPRTEAIRTYAEWEETHRFTAEAFRLDRRPKKADLSAWRGYLAHRAAVAEANDPEPKPLPAWRFCCAPCGLYHLTPSDKKPVPLLEVDPDA